MKWSYGVTTVAERVYNGLLERTLASLKTAGFPEPHLFVDGMSPGEWEQCTGAMGQLNVTLHKEKIRTYGNWVLAAWELYARVPDADRYAVFQDDFVTYRNLRQYLEHCEYPARGYWNLYTFPQNEKKKAGWYESNQLGKGAVGLIFSNEALRTLLATQYMVDRPLNPNRGWKAVDGGVVSAFKKMVPPWKELVHNPSLVQHTGLESTMGNSRHALANTFKGEDFDALSMLHPFEIKERDPEARRMGLVGPNGDSPVGTTNWELATECDFGVWLVRSDGQHAPRHPHPDVDTIYCRKGSSPKLLQFLDMVDVVVFTNDPGYREILPLAKARHKRIIAVMTTDEVHEKWTPFVDLFICGSMDVWNALKDKYPCAQFPWPNKWRTGADREFNLLCRTGEHRVAVI